MMKKLFFGLFIMFSLHLVGQNDFRKMNWGDSPADLKAKYPDAEWASEEIEGGRIYLTDDYVGGLDAKIAYYFIDGKLQIGLYLFEEYHSADNLYYEDFISISTLLNKKYEMDLTENWNDSSWKGDMDYIGYALSMGHVQIEESFEDNRTAITHKISGDGPGIQHFLRYASMDHIQSLRDAALDDF